MSARSAFVLSVSILFFPVGGPTVDEEDDGPSLGFILGFRDISRDASDCLLAALGLPVLDLAREAARRHSYTSRHCGAGQTLACFFLFLSKAVN